VGIRLRGLLTVVRPATEADAELLTDWHADPEVARYWDWETFTLEEMRRRLARPDVDHYVIEAGGEPVGYLQAWSDDGFGLDMFLIPSARGRGYGPDAARTLARRLVAEGRRPLTVDPYAWNERAVRAWRRAGFEPVDERPPDGEHPYTWVLMEFRE
jgi:aminoglycoside 6'-N-acetyltransferase